jgi:hypothetical protein
MVQGFEDIRPHQEKYYLETFRICSNSIRKVVDRLCIFQSENPLRIEGERLC